jgi:hypothetical protein
MNEPANSAVPIVGRLVAVARSKTDRGKIHGNFMPTAGNRMSTEANLLTTADARIEELGPRLDLVGKDNYIYGWV